MKKRKLIKLCKNFNKIPFRTLPQLVREFGEAIVTIGSDKTEYHSARNFAYEFDFLGVENETDFNIKTEEYFDKFEQDIIDKINIDLRSFEQQKTLSRINISKQLHYVGKTKNDNMFKFEAKVEWQFSSFTLADCLEMNRHRILEAVDMEWLLLNEKNESDKEKLCQI